MSKKKQIQAAVITPLRISVGLNVVLSLIIVSAAAVSIWGYHQYTGGTHRAARFALVHMNDYCDMYYRNINTWLKEAEDKGEPLSPDQIKESKLNTDAVCVNEDFEPYAKKALEDYYKANGLDLFPE